MYELHFDGAFQNSSQVHDAGVMGIGWFILDEDCLLAHGYGVTASGVYASSNLAEYLALIDGLQALVDRAAGKMPVAVFGDARVVISQMTGTAFVNANGLISAYRHARKLAHRLNIVAWEWVPRAQNKLADLLTRRALREFHANPIAVQEAWTTILNDNKFRRNRLHNLGGMLVFQRLAGASELVL